MSMKKVADNYRKEILDILAEYQKKFDDAFPMFEFGSDLEAAINEAKKCIKSGKPYKSKLKKGELS